jgi:hypothetical protein
MADNSLQERYRDALAKLSAQLQEDRYVLAAIIGGSLSYDQVWERSDLDLFVITTDDLKAPKMVSLSADGINTHAMVYPRSKFKAGIQSAVRSSFFHSMFSKSTLLFSKDETLAELYNEINHVGKRDREMQTLSRLHGVLYALTKGEKWFRVKRDWNYTFFFLMKGMDDLAAVEVIRQGEIPTREVIAQALKLNPEFFGRVYTGLIEGPKNEETMGVAIEAIRGYVLDRREMFNPVLEYLSEAGGARSATEISHYFEHNWGFKGADFVCEWLADEDLIHKVSTPVRLVEKSKVTLEEVAYYYEDCAG